MTEAEYISKIAASWPRNQRDALLLLSLIDRAMTEHPGSARLLCVRGDLIQLADEGGSDLDEALACYEKAAELDPTLAEAYESIGHYCDAITDDFERAERAYRRAIELGAGEDSTVGLVRVMAQRGTPTQELLAILDTSPHAKSAKVKRFRVEIAEGSWSPMEEG